MVVLSFNNTIVKSQHLVTSCYFSYSVLLVVVMTTVAPTALPLVTSKLLPTGSNVTTVDSAAGDGNSSVVVASGTDLYCYECSEQYGSTFDPVQSPCLTNLSLITVRQCSPGDAYCQVTRETINQIGFILSMSRGCVGSCNYGCYSHIYGAGRQVCTSCCRSPGCNHDNSAPRLTYDVSSWLVATIVTSQIVQAA